MNDFLSVVAKRALGEPPEVRPVVPAVIPPSLALAAEGRSAPWGGQQQWPPRSIADEQVTQGAGARVIDLAESRAPATASPNRPPAPSATRAVIPPRQDGSRSAPSPSETEPAWSEGEGETAEVARREPRVASSGVSEWLDREPSAAPAATAEIASGDPASGPVRATVPSLLDLVVPDEAPDRLPPLEKPPFGFPPGQGSPARPLPVEALKPAPAPVRWKAWEGDDDRDERPTVHVSIGRIEVRSAAPAAPAAAPPRPVGPRVTLDDYLTRRDVRDRR